MEVHNGLHNVAGLRRHKHLLIHEHLNSDCVCGPQGVLRVGRKHRGNITVGYWNSSL